MDNFPGYHTAIDNMTLVNLEDPGFKAHIAMSQLVGDIILQLVSSARLPFDCREYVVSLGEYFDSLKATIGANYNINKLGEYYLLEIHVK